jgi:uncharacterized RDD family membrane protein YckC
MVTSDKGARLGNILIDTTIFFILALIVGVVLELIADFMPFQAYLIIATIYPYILYFIYYFLFESLKGKTPGKYVTKTTVVDRNGNKPSIRGVVLRNIIPMLPYDWFSYIFGFSGLHDSLSKTIVVNDAVLNKHRNKTLIS